MGSQRRSVACSAYASLQHVADSRMPGDLFATYKSSTPIAIYVPVCSIASIVSFIATAPRKFRCGEIAGAPAGRGTLKTQRMEPQIFAMPGKNR
jgi:hypothetical protein